MRTTTAPESDGTTARDLLEVAYASPGPYVSAYVPRHKAGVDITTTIESLEGQRGGLIEAGATEEAVDAIAARLTLPAPGDAGGQGVIAAADGTTVARFAPEGPAEPFIHVDGLPYAAPLLEWDQWRVAHLAVAVGDDVTEIMVFLPDAESWVIPVLDPIETAERCRALAEQYDIDLMVIGGSEVSAGALRQRLAGTLPITIVVSVVTEAEVERSGGFADAVVRQVADHVARTTVGVLRDFRFLEAHEGTVEGADAVFGALAAGPRGRLLVHDDPTDSRRAWFGRHPTDVGLGAAPLLPGSARLVDVAIWSAIRAGIDVYVIPTTGDTGPAGNIGLAEYPPGPSPVSPGE